MTPDPHFACPLKAADHLLEVTRAALVSGAPEQYCARFLVPSEIGCERGTQVLKSPEDVRDLYERVRLQMISLGATDLHRVLLNAEYLDDTTLLSEFRSQWVRGATLVGTPYQSRSTSVLRNGVWMLKSGFYGVGSNALLSRAMSGQ